MNESAEIWSDAARCLEFQRDFQGAAQCYEFARKAGDESPETLLNLAASYIHLYDFYRQDKYLESAKKFLISGLEKDERNHRLHHYLGLVYLALGERETAAEEFFAAQEHKVEEEIAQFGIPEETPAVYESKKHDVYELFPDPALYRLFDLVKGFPLDSALFQNLKDTYGERDSTSLLALYLRSTYYKVFEDKEFASALGLSTSQSKWEALLVFFVRGINSESKSLVKNAVKGGKLNTSLLPVYSRLFVERYRRELLSSAQDMEGMKALIMLPLKRLEALESACELAKNARTGKKSANAIVEALAEGGFAHRKNSFFIFSEALLKDFEGVERLKAKLSAGEYDSEFFILVHGLLKRRRFEYALSIAKKVKGLYEEGEATAYVKDILSSVSLSEEEQFVLLSEI